MARKASSVAPARTSRTSPAPVKSVLDVIRHPGLVWLLFISSVLLLILLALAIAGEHGFVTMWHMQREVGRLAEEVHTIEGDNRGLQHEVWRLRHDMTYIEQLARQELGLVRPGELIFEFIE